MAALPVFSIVLICLSAKSLITLSTDYLLPLKILVAEAAAINDLLKFSTMLVYTSGINLTNSFNNFFLYCLV